MKITRLTLWHLPLTSHQPMNMANGIVCDVVRSTLLQIRTDTGLVGWGEAAPIPRLLPAYSDSVAPTLSEMADGLLGLDPVGPEPIMARLNRLLPGHSHVKSAIDMALWDITARAVGMPLHKMLGGTRMRDAPVMHIITCDTPSNMARAAKTAHLAGVRLFQAKLGADDDWRLDVERAIKLREAIGLRSVLSLDWNGGLDRFTAIRLCRRLMDLDVILEQPCTALEDNVAVKQATGLPMKLDEGVHGIAQLIKAHEAGCLDAAAINLSGHGGIGAARLARDLCVAIGVPVTIEDSWGSDITTAACLHVGVSTSRQMLKGITDLSSYVSPRIDRYAPTRTKGFLRPLDSPGLGIEPDLDTLANPVVVID
jgi:L-alanine-DL-glutamate epimerase-like enolase superfamily enzyme